MLDVFRRNPPTPLLFLLTALCLLGSGGCTRQADAPAGGEYLAPGPWGRVRIERIVLTPPDSALPDSAAPPAFKPWVFEGRDRGSLAEFFAGLDLPDAQFTNLIEAVRPGPREETYLIQPSPELIRSLNPAARAAIYNILAQNPQNLAHINAYRFWGETPADWFADSGLSTSTRHLVEPLIYRHGALLWFADLSTVLPHIPEADERQRLLRTLARETSLRLILEVRESDDVEPLATYWGRGGREREIRERLNALASQGGGEIDCRDLLPPFARQRLHTYPTPGIPGIPGTAPEPDLPGDDSRDCHWTAFNFFHDTPDDRFANAQTVANLFAIREPVTTPALGDLAVFSSGGEVYHTAVHVAGGVLFTRNGTRSVRPWMLITEAAMTDFYPRSEPTTIRYLQAIPSGN